MNQTTITKQRGLSDFALKYFAMVCMILDHIHYFFSFTGKIPLFFSWIGRLAAPLFLFCIVEGFLHTHDRKKYFLRIYAIAIFMGLVQFSFYNIASGLVRPDGFFPQNQMLASFSVLLVVLWGIDRCQKKQWIRGLSAILIPVFLPFLLYGLFAVSAAFGIPYGNFLLNLLVYSVLPCHTAIIDGGTATLLGGVILYLTHRHRKLQAGAFALFVLAWDILPVLLLCPQELLPLSFLPMLMSGWKFLPLSLCYVTMEPVDTAPKSCSTGFIRRTFTCCTHFRSFCT